jgi:hypothetical protein
VALLALELEIVLNNSVHCKYVLCF